MGLPIDVFDEIRDGLRKDRVAVLQGPQRAVLRREPAELQGVTGRCGTSSGSAVDDGRPQGRVRLRQGVLRDRSDDDLEAIDVPTLIIHGDDDQIVPIVASAMKSSKIVKDSQLKIYPGAPHGLTSTHKDQFNADLLAFLKA